MIPPIDVPPQDLAVDKSDDELQDFYRQLQAYLEWSPADAERVASLHAIMQPHFPAMVHDFYAEILRHAATRQVLQGEEQVHRLKQTLIGWLQQLFSGPYDLEYVKARWRVGRRHVLIGLDQTYATAALGRLRTRINDALAASLDPSAGQIAAALRSINKLLDLESAIINAAYQLSFARLMELSAKQQMQQSERLAAIGQMVTGLAHESRNALQRSHACLETLALEMEDRPDAVRLVQRVQTALDHLHTLYEEVRNYAAPIKLDRQVVSLPKLILRCWQQLEHKWRPSQTRLKFDVTEQTPKDLRVDATRMEQVLTNLFQNGIDASGEEGEVCCHVYLQTTGGAEVTPPTNGESRAAEAKPVEARVVIEVSDSGPGVSVNPPNKIFEPFFTTKTKGTGLGLAISRRAVQAHGGEIELVAQTKATFRITLPTT
jgi:signal transduction histidine kinase